MSWFKRKDDNITTNQSDRGKIPAGLWVKCDQCGEIIYQKEVAASGMVCPKCAHHFPIPPEVRLEQLFGEGPYEFLFRNIQPDDPLEFSAVKSYKDQLKRQADKKKIDEAVVVVEGKLGGKKTIVAIMDFSFLGGSMGSVVGEKLTLAVEAAVEKKEPLVIFSCSGGARMMEGALSLMQMAKVSAALARLDHARIPFISVLTHPTTGGVTASFAMLGDVNIAEPGALIGFAGPRVIQQTIKADLPKGFQRSEYLLAHGMVDRVVPRNQLKNELVTILNLLYA
ncbi:MAG: acetyl-CoA carboxylase carboxyl transferase subunit beta [Acidobacteria bacterium]|nr:MAG: acetyl-CoA carboxylase carboxyl transferase subunit beta [Acidobacteriota bacterium]